MGKPQAYTKNEVVDLYKPCNGNSAEAARRLNNRGIQITNRTVLNIWKSANLETKKQGGNNKPSLSIEERLGELEISRIIRSHRMYEGNPNRAARYGAYSYSTYRKVWERQGLEIRTRSHDSY